MSMGEDYIAKVKKICRCWSIYIYKSYTVVVSGSSDTIYPPSLRKRCVLGNRRVLIQVIFKPKPNEFINCENRPQRGIEKTWLVKDNNIHQLACSKMYRNIINIKKAIYSVHEICLRAPQTKKGMVKWLPNSKDDKMASNNTRI